MQPGPRPQPQDKPGNSVSVEESMLILLRGIQNHPASTDEAKDREFRGKLATLEASFDKAKENAKQVAESAVDLLAQYNSDVNRMVARQRSDLVKAASELVSAGKGLKLVAGPADRLTSLEQRISALSSVDDLISAKAELISELAMARAEALNERQKISSLISGTITQLATLPAIAAGDPGQASGPAPTRDNLTGLPARPLAEAELIRVHQESGDTFLGLFVVKRLALINAKFGYARGDQVLLKVVAHLANALAGFESLFRWTPCAFIALAPPSMAFRDVRSKVQTIELTRLTPTLEWEGHNAMVPVAMDCRVISVKDFSTVSELFLRLDTFGSDV